MEFTFGTDPEFFLRLGPLEKNAIPIIKRGKKNPIIIGENSFYYDNVLAECTVKPGGNAAEVIENIRIALRKFTQLIRPYTLAGMSSYRFNPDDFSDCKEAFIVGCKEEWCAYDLKPISNVHIKTIIEDRKNGLRAAGGHIHLGAEFLQEELNRVRVVRMLDLFLAVPMFFAFPYTDWRRNLYGMAGRYRRKPYGLEYRTLSNRWLQSPTLVRFVFNACEKVLDIVKSGRYDQFKLDDKEYQSNLRKIIDKGNVYNMHKGIPFIKEVEKVLGYEIPYYYESYDFYSEWDL